MEVAITKLKMELLCNPEFVFFVTILFSLSVEVDDSIPTACTDGKSIKLNTQFWMSLSKEERIFLMLHEIMHIALNHITRLGDREPRRFNHACDYAINYDLVQAGYKMPSAGLYDKQYADMTAEQIYDLLPEDGEYDENDIEFSDDKELKKTLEETLIRAGAAALLGKQGIGVLPNSAKRMLDELLNPQLPWEEMFQDLMFEHSTDDYSMQYPDEEYMSLNLYVPTLYSEGMGSINCYCDVSGSVTQHIINIALVELNSMKERLKPREVNLISFDTKIHLETTYDAYDEMDVSGIDLSGGGGTEVRDIYKHIEDKNPEISVIISDGQFHDRPLKTDSHVIYLITDNPNFSSQHGETIHINTGDY